jgi:hypothetical protein
VSSDTLIIDWRIAMSTELIIEQIEQIVAQMDAVTAGLQRLIEEDKDVF